MKGSGWSDVSVSGSDGVVLGDWGREFDGPVVLAADVEELPPEDCLLRLEV